MSPRTKALLFGGDGGNSPPADLGLLVLRLAFGLALAFGHGMGKLPPGENLVRSVTELGFPLPGLFAWAAALSEFGGGLLLALGLLTRPAAAFVLFTMAVAFFLQHAGDPFGDREASFLFASAALTLLLTGSGRYGVDATFRRRDSGRYVERYR